MAKLDATGQQWLAEFSNYNYTISYCSGKQNADADGLSRVHGPDTVSTIFPEVLKVKSMQRPGTEAIGTLIQPSKPKQEITEIIHSQNTKRTYGQLSEQLFPKNVFPKSGHSATQTELKFI